MQNIDSDLIRGNIDTIILKTMLSGDMYGLDIIKEVENKSNGTYELKQPTLYSCLKRLENQELISSYWLDSDIGGKRHYYKLTEKGHEELSKKQEEWSKSKFIIDNLLGNFNAEEYRLVKKDDYNKIIEGKKFEYTEEDSETKDLAEAQADSTPAPSAPVYIEREYTEVVVPDRESSLEDIPNQGDSNIYLSNETDINEAFNNFDIKPDGYDSQENNILARLRAQEAEEINTYYGNNQAYTREPVQEKQVIQQNLLDAEITDSDDQIEESVDEFERNIAELNNFQMISSNEEEVEEETIVEEPQIEDYEEEQVEELEPVSDEIDEEVVESSSSNAYQEGFLDELSELGYANYQNDYKASEDEIKTETAPLVANTYAPVQNAQEPAYENKVEYEEEVVEDEPYNPNDELWDSFTTEEAQDFASPSQPEPEPVFYENIRTNQTTFDDIIKNNTYFTPKQEPTLYNSENDFVSVSSNDEPYKQKLQNLSSYSKVTTIKNDESLKKAKDINALKDEFENEGIKVTQYKKDSIDEASKNYLLINKLNVIKSFILLFGYIFLLSALYIILGSTNFKTTKGFSFICFLYGFIPFAVYAIYSLVMFLVKPYRKIPAKYAPGIMFFISAIITVQLLLITYCVNLQFGFYSFVQSGYNHLNWIIPLVISFAPVISTGIHCGLFYSRNFNV